MQEPKIPAPIKYPKLSKAPVILQMEALECGAASLAMVLAYYGRWVSAEQLRKDCGIGRDGSKAKNIVRAARSYGLSAKGKRCPADYLKNEATFPCILFWNNNHFVVLNGFKRDKALINDPAKGFMAVDYRDFKKAYSGVCLIFEPTEDFKPAGKRKSTFVYALKALASSGTAFTFAAVTLFITSVISLLMPGFTEFFTDYILGENSSDFLLPFALILGGVSLIFVVISGINRIYSSNLEGKAAASGSSSYMWKVLHLPMVFFSQRSTEDIISRKDDSASAANTLVSFLAPLVVNVLMMIFYLAVMLGKSPILSVIGIVNVFINLLLTTGLTKNRRSLAAVRVRTKSKMLSTQVGAFNMIETIKASGAEEEYFRRWAACQADDNSVQTEQIRLDNLSTLFPNMVNTICNCMIVCVGAFLVMGGHFTIGAVMAFQGLAGNFFSPVKNVVNSGSEINMMRVSMERIEDVMNYPDDDICVYEAEDGDITALTGNIELKDVDFGYNALEEPLLKDFRLSIKAESRVAFVGHSGCGKSTIGKLISGLYAPLSGEILFDGKPINMIDKDLFRNSVAVVDQDITLFSASIADNISLFDETITDFEIRKAAEDALIHDTIAKRSGGYSSILADNGADLSGGERQRIEIARALVRNPAVLILDEATSALDAKTEAAIMKNLRDRACTTIIIAHRLSTIRECDSIVVIDKGMIQAVGTHEELLKSCPLYKDLVAAE